MNEKLTIGSMFSGIGGLELGLERTGGFETRWQCEINEYARKVLAKNWPGLPLYNDVKELYESEQPERVDVLCGGFPCQPFSTAGKRRGESDERFLWPEFIRIVREVRPRWVIAENVPGLLTIDAGRVFGRILGDLASCGYDAEWDTISAASVGALHPRNRIFIIGHNGNAPGRYPFSEIGGTPGRTDAQPGGDRHVLADADRPESGIHPGAIPETPGNVRGRAPSDLSSRCGQVLADTDRPRLEEQWFRKPTKTKYSSIERSSIDVPDTEERGNVRGIGQLRYAGPLELGRRDNGLGTFRDAVREWWAIEPGMGRVANGVPARVDRLRCLGNAVVPQCAEYVGNCILQREGLI